MEGGEGVAECGEGGGGDRLGGEDRVQEREGSVVGVGGNEWVRGIGWSKQQGR